MKLSDVVGHSGLATYTVIAMLLFLAAFLGIVAWLFRPGRGGELEAQRRIPLEDDLPITNPGDPS